MKPGEFHDRRLVEVYDAECLWGRDDDFFRSVVNETPAAGYSTWAAEPAASHSAWPPLATW